ncbi:MAG: AAA family ATPase [Pseudomonadota bacterium]
MYHQHFGLNESPFSLTPDTEYFFNYASHCDALNTLLAAIKMGEGFIKVVGEVGTGKTLLCRSVLKMLGDDIVTAYIPNPMLTSNELREALADELGLSVEQDQDRDPHRLLKRIYRELVRLRSEGKKIVLLIDEAQAIPNSTLEALRLLTNLETEKYKLLQVVLIGQPELDERLKRQSVRQLKQRITFSCELELIDRNSIDGYVLHRLNVAGYSGARLFSSRAISLLAKASRGVPRIINVLCHKALMSAYGQGQARVDIKHVRDAIKDTEVAQSRRHHNWQLADIGLSVCVLIGLGLVYVGTAS